MTARRRYRDRKYVFGKQLLTLRTRAGLTQHGLAQQVGVHVRSVQNWETGESYPRAETLQRLIAVFLSQHVLTYGNERQEAEALWELVSTDGPHALASFDPVWFDQTVALHTPVHEAGASMPEQTPQPVTATVFAPEIEPTLVYGNSQTYWAFGSSALDGRQRELGTLYQWMVEDPCRVVVVLGSAGIGKSHLARAAAQRFASHFDLVVFHSLQNQPPLNQILDQTIRAISDPHTLIPFQWSDKITLLLQLFRERRCLLILDHFETILQPNALIGAYHTGLGEYGTLLARLSVRDHQSCLLLASRTLPAELGVLTGQNRPVRSLSLSGIDSRACQTMLRQRAIMATADDFDRLAERFNGNPLALHLVPAFIREAFAGNTEAFLTSDVLFNSLDHLIEWHYAHLTTLEQIIVRWLAIERSFVSVDKLLANQVATIMRDSLINALAALHSRGLIESANGQSTFALHPAILDWVTNDIVEIAVQEIATGRPELVQSHALMLATSEEHIRLAQERLIAAPLLQRLALVCGGQDAAEQQLLRLLEGWRNQPLDQHGYGPGNVVNLLRLQRGDLRDLDMTQLLIRQAYLLGVEAQSPTLAGSSLQDAIFADRLWQTWRGW